MSEHLPSAPSPLKGVFLLASGVFLFALGDTVGKILFATWNVPLVLALRYVLNAAILLAVLVPRHGLVLFRVRRWKLVVLRAAILATSSITFGLALQRMPVGETVAINYLAPFLVIFLSVPILGEQVGPRGWIAAFAGFLGVLLIVRPGGGLNTMGVVFALLTALGTVGYQILTRLLSRSETTMALLVWTALIGTVIYGAALPWTLYGPAPTAQDALLLGVVTLCTTLGHFLFTAAYRLAPAAYLAPVNYLHIVWATLLGWLAFAHLPDGLTVLGMGAVLAAGVFGALARPRARQTDSSAQIGT